MQRKLTPEQAEEVRSALKQRQNLRKYIKQVLGNVALAEKYGVHTRTIEKIAYREESWRFE